MMLPRGILLALMALMAMPGCALHRRFVDRTSSPVDGQQAVLTDATSTPLAPEFQRLPLEPASSAGTKVQLVSHNEPANSLEIAQLPQNPFEDDDALESPLGVLDPGDEPPDPTMGVLESGGDEPPEPPDAALDLDSMNPAEQRQDQIDDTLPMPSQDPALDPERGLLDDGRADDDDLPFLQVMPIPEEEECVDDNPLALDEVIQSVAQSFPMVEAALTELGIAEGKALAAWGSFDTNLTGHSKNQPLGFYENYRQGIALARPLWNGGEVYGGYRIGRGEFEPWYLERETNAGGEFHVGAKVPLLKNFAIDDRRADLFKAQLEVGRTAPDVQSQLIAMQRTASLAYWKWVAEGQILRIQQRMLALAEVRNENLIRQVEEGDQPRITEIDNGRFIALRLTKVIESQRKVQESAIKLSLFLRDAQGEPVIVDDSRLPCDFPVPVEITTSALEADIGLALAQRPELLELDFQARQTQVELCVAQNKTLPKLDAYTETQQDMGAPTSSKRDKSPLVLELGLVAEVPLQRREAFGKIEAARAKLTQINAKRRFTIDKIRSQIQDVFSALDNAYRGFEQALRNRDLARQSLVLGRRLFEEGDIDLIQLNIYETALADAEQLLTNTELVYYASLADYRAALGVRPFTLPQPAEGGG